MRGGDLARGKDLACARLPAEPCRQAERRTAVATLDRNGLAGAESDPDREGKLGLVDRLVDGQDWRSTALRIASRAEEDAHRLVALQLEERAAARLDDLANHVGELAASLAAASSPRSCVNSVQPRTSAMSTFDPRSPASSRRHLVGSFRPRRMHMEPSSRNPSEA